MSSPSEACFGYFKYGGIDVVSALKQNDIMSVLCSLDFIPVPTMSGRLGVDLASIEALRTFIPAVFSLSCAGISLLSYVFNLWKPTRSLFEFLGRPFRPFLTLDDVAEYEPSLKKIEVPSIETISLRVLCFIQTIGWLSWTALSIANGVQHGSLIGSILISLAWVSLFHVLLLGVAQSALS